MMWHYVIEDGAGLCSNANYRWVNFESALFFETKDAALEFISHNANFSHDYILSRINIVEKTCPTPL